MKYTHMTVLVVLVLMLIGIDSFVQADACTHACSLGHAAFSAYCGRFGSSGKVGAACFAVVHAPSFSKAACTAFCKHYV